MDIPPGFEHLIAWAASDDPVKRRAAAHRLAVGFDTPPAPPPLATPAPTELELLRTLPPCPHVRLCGCSSPGLECGPGGVKPGARVTRQECLACLATPRA